MTTITQSHSGSDAVGIINANIAELGSSVETSNTDAATVCAALNGVFDDFNGVTVLADTMSGGDFVAAVNANFAIAFDQEEEGDLGKFKFLHLSDPHGNLDAITLCKNSLGVDTSFLFITGDMSRYGYNSISKETTDLLGEIDNGRLLLLAGNHDVYEHAGASQATMTAYLAGFLNGVVKWGDSSDNGATPNTASYWYKDFPIGSHKLRIISIDQYETSLRSYPNYTMYRQSQINWFIARLKELNAGDYLIIATHEPPVQSRTVPQGGGSGDTYPDDYAVGLRPSSNADTAKLFVTEGLRAFGNRRSEPNWNLLPRIMDAYLNKRTLTMTYNNYGGGSPSDITINEDFSQDNPATFLFYLGGHRHADICTYLPNETGATDGGDWSDQLMLYITTAHRDISYQYDDDLGGSSNWLGTPSVQSTDKYRFNEVELDFDAKTITVTRYGDQKTYGGRVRNEVVFPFVKGGES